MERNLTFAAADVGRIHTRLTWSQLEIVSTKAEEIQVFIAGDEESVQEVRVEQAEGAVTIAQSQLLYAKEILPRTRWMQICVRLPRAWQGEVDIDAVSGMIGAHAVRARTLSVSTISGAINVRDVQAGAISLHTVSGHIAGANLTAAERVSLRSVSGAMRIDESAFGQGKLFTVSGDATLVLAAGCRQMDSQSVSGAICVETPGPVKASLRSLSGQFLVDEDLMPKDGEANDTPALEITASSVSGDLAVKRRRTS